MQSTKKRSYVTIIVIVSVAFSGAVVASALLPLAKVAFAKSENLYAIYYGHLVDEKGSATDQTNRILAAKPER